MTSQAPDDLARMRFFLKLLVQRMYDKPSVIAYFETCKHRYELKVISSDAEGVGDLWTPGDQRVRVVYLPIDASRSKEARTIAHVLMLETSRTR